MKNKHTIEQLQLFLHLFELQVQFEESKKGWILDHNFNVFGQVYIDQKRQLISNIDCPYGLIDTKVDLDSGSTMFPFRIQRRVGEQLDGKLFFNPTKPGGLKIDGFSIEAKKQEENINQIQIFAQGNCFTYQNYATGDLARFQVLIRKMGSHFSPDKEKMLLL